MATWLNGWAHLKWLNEPFFYFYYEWLKDIPFLVWVGWSRVPCSVFAELIPEWHSEYRSGFWLSKSLKLCHMSQQYRYFSPVTFLLRAKYRSSTTNFRPICWNLRNCQGDKGGANLTFSTSNFLCQWWRKYYFIIAPVAHVMFLVLHLGARWETTAKIVGVFVLRYLN